MNESSTSSRASSHAIVPPDLLERSEAVVVAQARQAEQAGLERVEALRNVVAGDDRVDEALGRLVGDLVREVARGDPAVVAAQPVLDRALVQDRVQHVAPRAEPGPKRLGDGCGDPAALGLVGQPRQLRERLVEREVLAVERDAQVGEQLVEEAAPGADAGDALLRRDLLLRLASAGTACSGARSGGRRRSARARDRRAGARRRRRRARSTRGRRRGARCRSACSARAPSGRARRAPGRSCRPPSRRRA